MERKYSTLTKLLAASQKLKGNDTTDNSGNKWKEAGTAFGAHFSIENYSKSRLRIFIYSRCVCVVQHVNILHSQLLHLSESVVYSDKR